MKEIEPWIVEIDPQLKAPEQLALHVKGMERDEGKKSGQWLLELVYTTEVGEVPVFNVWEALEEGKKHLFSPAGLLDLTRGRFEWLKILTKKRFSKGGKKVRLSALEWIRVQSVELVTLPEGQDKKDKKVREIGRAHV